MVRELRRRIASLDHVYTTSARDQVQTDTNHRVRWIKGRDKLKGGLQNLCN